MPTTALRRQRDSHHQCTGKNVQSRANRGECFTDRASAVKRATPQPPESARGIGAESPNHNLGPNMRRGLGSDMRTVMSPKNPASGRTKVGCRMQMLGFLTRDRSCSRPTPSKRRSVTTQVSTLSLYNPKPFLGMYMPTRSDDRLPHARLQAHALPITRPGWGPASPTRRAQAEGAVSEVFSKSRSHRALVGLPPRPLSADDWLAAAPTFGDIKQRRGGLARERLLPTLDAKLA